LCISFLGQLYIYIALDMEVSDFLLAIFPATANVRSAQVLGHLEVFC